MVYFNKCECADLRKNKVLEKVWLTWIPPNYQLRALGLQNQHAQGVFKEFVHERPLGKLRGYMFPERYKVRLGAKGGGRKLASKRSMAATTALSPKLVSLRDLPSGLLLAAAAALSPKLVSLQDLYSGLFLAAAPAVSSKLIPLHDFPFWAALGCPCGLVSQACLPS